MWLELALVVFGSAILAAVGVLLIGRLQGDARGRRGQAEAPPRVGNVDAERHRNIGAVAAR
jgi:hypothetical protein